MGRKVWIAAAILMFVLLLVPPQANAHRRFGVSVGPGFGFAYPSYIYPYSGYPYYPYYNAYTPYYNPYTPFYYPYYSYPVYGGFAFRGWGGGWGHGGWHGGGHWGGHHHH